MSAALAVARSRYAEGQRHAGNRVNLRHSDLDLSERLEVASAGICPDWIPDH